MALVLQEIKWRRDGGGERGGKQLEWRHVQIKVVFQSSGQLRQELAQRTSKYKVEDVDIEPKV